MRLLWQELRSRLQYKIIVPFLLLTLCVALAGSLIAFSLVAGSWQERLDNQLAQAMRATNDSLLEQERSNLEFLREVALAPANERANAPAVATALGNGDVDGLNAALEPYFRAGTRRATVRIDRLIAFDTGGQTLADFERVPGTSGEDYFTHEPLDVSQHWFVPAVLQAQADDLGDKYAGLLLFPDTETYYFATIAPVREGDEVVGGLIAAMQLDSLLRSLAERSNAAIVTAYDIQGVTLVSSATAAGGLGGLNIPDATLEMLLSAAPATSREAVFNVANVNGRPYQFAYTPLRVRGANVGVISAALSRDYVIGAWSDARVPLALLTMVLMLLIVVLGVFIARLITAPLQELVLAARAVTEGDFNRRSQVAAHDEIGVLSQSFNHMTGYLLQLYGKVQTESSQRAAIVDSIVDGIVVTDELGNVLLINRAVRKLAYLSEDAALPAQLSDLPLVRIAEGMPGFDANRADDLYTINEFIVRVSIAPVVTDENERLGYVCVLQDMTSEVAVQRAKTNFIGTISHELRTPLTVMRGNADLLMRGLVGPLEDEQKLLVDTIRQHATNMANLLNNVIMIAGLDSGSLATDLEEFDLHRVVDEAIWPLRAAIKAKELGLTVDVPEDLPPVIADFSQVRVIVQQLVDNARRYTEAGAIRVSAVCEGAWVRIEVADTGRGIPASLEEQVFERFMRGDGADEGINSAERGIGLGLAIVKQLVERQGGAVWFSSRLAQGTTFNFTLRYSHETGSPENQHQHAEIAA